MISFIFLLLVISTSLAQMCTEPGLFPSVDERVFLVCEEGSNGEMVTHQGECDFQSVYDPKLKLCVMKNGYQRNNPVMSLEKRSKSQCYKMGYSCSADCKKLNFCFDRGNGFEVIESKDCHENESCSAYTNSCENTTISQCKDDYEFKCNYLGIFPDPYKCDTYYFCESAGAFPVTLTCPKNTYYDPLYTECIQYEIDETPPCPSMKKCEHDFTMFALERNPNIYYICIWQDKGEFVTRVFRCERNKVFDGDKCVESNTISTSGLISI